MTKMESSGGRKATRRIPRFNSPCANGGRAAFRLRPALACGVRAQRGGVAGLRAACAVIRARRAGEAPRRTFPPFVVTCFTGMILSPPPKMAHPHGCWRFVALDARLLDFARVDARHTRVNIGFRAFANKTVFHPVSPLESALQRHAHAFSTGFSTAYSQAIAEPARHRHARRIFPCGVAIWIQPCRY